MNWPTERLQTRLSLPAESLEEVYALLSQIDAVKQSWKITGNLKPQIIQRLTRSVIITSTGASNRIEGNQLSDAEVETLYRNLRIQKFRTRDQQEVGGYLESMEFVFSHFTSLVSHEKLIEQQKADYYLALNQTQKNWKSEREDITPWLLFFLKIVHRQAELALEILLRDDREALLSENQQNILDWIRTREADAFSRGDIIAAFDLPARTIEASVKRLLEHRLIERLGAGRSTRYRYLSATSRKTE